MSTEQKIDLRKTDVQATESERAPAMGGVGWSFSQVLLIACAALVLVGVFVASPGERPPIYGLEANGFAAAESVAFDRDLEFGEADLERFRTRHGVAPEGLHLEASGEDPSKLYFAHHWLWALLAAAWVAVAPIRGAALLNAVLFLIGVVVTTRSLVRRLGSEAAGLVLVACFFCWLPAFVFVTHPAILAFTATAVAVAIVTRGENPALSQIPDVHEEGTRGSVRWIDVLAGVLATVPLAWHPIYLLVPLGLVASIQRDDRLRRGARVVAGAMICFAVLSVVRAQRDLPLPWFREVAVFSSESGFPPELSEAERSKTEESAGDFAEGALSWDVVERAAADPKALGWATLHAVVGRTVGWLPYFFPVVLLLGGWSRRLYSGLAFSALAGAAALVLLLPFDFAGYVGTAGNWAALPFYAMLLFVPTKLPSRWALIGTALVGAIAVWPLWLDPYSIRPNAGRVTRFVAPGLDRVLPIETTLRDVSREAISSGSKVLRVEPLTRSLRVIGGRDLEWARGLGAAGLLVSAPEGVDKIFLDFDANAGTALEVQGGDVVETLFRPNGRIGVVIELARGREHATARSLEPTGFYTLRFTMEDAKSDTIRFRCSADTVGG